VHVGDEGRPSELAACELVVLVLRGTAGGRKPERPNLLDLTKQNQCRAFQILAAPDKPKPIPARYRARANRSKRCDPCARALS